MRGFIFGIICGLGIAVAGAQTPNGMRGERITPAFQTGNVIYQHLRSDESFEPVFAMGYVVGSVDTLVALTQAQEDYQVIYSRPCLPPGFTISQAEDVAKKYLGDNPGQRHRAAGALILMAVYENFACLGD